MRYQRVKYKLIDKDRGKELWLTSDPIGWDESDKTLQRSTKTFGIWTELSKNLGFTEEAIDFLTLSRASKDVEADVELEEWRNFPDKDGFYLHSTGTFDFSDFKSDETKIKIPFKTGGLAALIKAQLKEKFELDRTESINGKIIDALDRKTVGLEGRKILLVTTWDTDNENTNIGSTGNQTIKVQVDTNVGDERGNINALPLRIVGQSHSGFAETVISSFMGSNSATISGDDGVHPGGNYQGAAVHKFFLNSDQDRTLDLTFDYDFNVWFQQYENVQWCFFSLSFVTYKNGSDLDVKDRVIIHELRSSDISAYNLGRTASGITQSGIFSDPILPNDNDAPLGKFNERMTGTHNTIVNLLQGESLAMELWLRSDMYKDPNAGVRVYIQDINCTMKIEEESYFAPTQAKVVLMHDVGEKLLQIITGEKLKYYSEFYGRIDDLGYVNDGKEINGNEFSRTGIAPGLWIRGFDDEKLEFSLDQLIETSNAIHNTGYTIQRIKDADVLVHEDMKYFFQDFVGINIPNQVSNVERKAAKEMYYSNMTFGYEKPSGDNLYEEAMGLDEYNLQSSYTTPITRVDKKYNKISKARADSYGVEFARRKSKELFPEEDTRYDKTAFLLDMKETSGLNLSLRFWADDYDQPPTGVFSPETATNLRITPFRNSERHQWFYASGLRVFGDEYIRHSNSIGNSNLGTKKAGEDEKFENDSIKISDLQRSLFINEWITFDAEVDFFINEQVYGTTQVNGRQIPNYFGKVKFINELGLVEYGYLFELKPNNEGKWKLLKAI